MTTPDVSQESAAIDIEITIENHPVTERVSVSTRTAAVTVATAIYELDLAGNRAGDAVAHFEGMSANVPAGGNATVRGSARLKNPKLWGPPPTQSPNRWLGDRDVLGELIAGCRKLGMVVIARTDPHAVCEAEPSKSSRFTLWIQPRGAGDN